MAPNRDLNLLRTALTNASAVERTQAAAVERVRSITRRAQQRNRIAICERRTRVIFDSRGRIAGTMAERQLTFTGTSAPTG